MFKPTQYNNNCNYLTIAYSNVTELFTYTLKTPNNTFLLVSPTCVEHDLEHLLYGLGYSQDEEDFIDNLSLEQSKLCISNPIEDDKGKLKRKLTWEHPTLILNNWYYFLDVELKTFKKEQEDFEVGFYFLPDKAKLMYAI